MPMAIYSKAMEGGYGSALWMVLVFLAVAGVVMYVSTRMSKKAVKE
jgi:ABC-type molybdate transport system permease subunit